MSIVLGRKGGGGSGGGAPSGPAGGNLTGTYPNPTLAAGSVDADAIDGTDATAIVADLGIAAFADYTPALTASGSNPTLGTGSSVDGRWCQIGNLGIVWVLISFGTSGTAVGSGDYRVSVPFTIGANQVQQTGGSGHLFDSSAGDTFPVGAYPTIGATYCRLLVTSSLTAGFVTAAFPYAPAASDEIHLFALLEIA